MFKRDWTLLNVVALWLVLNIFILVSQAAVVVVNAQINEDTLSPMFRKVVEIQKSICVKPVPCGIEEVVTWESEDKHKHYTFFTLVNVEREEDIYIRRLVFIFTLLPDGKIKTELITFLDEEKEA